MNAVEERYLHLCCCLEWLNESWALLQSLANQRQNPLFAPSFRFALILYAKAFRESRGNAVRKHRLDSSFVPVALCGLHETVLNERDQLHAHTDLTLMDAKLTVRTIERQNIAVLVRNHLEPTQLASRLDAVLNLVEQVIENLQADVKALEGQLPTTEA